VAGKILLALASRDETELLKKALSSHEVLSVSNGLECMDKFRTFNPSLVVLDLLLPRMHGIEIAERLKKEKNPPGIILVADEPLIQAHDAAKALKVDEFLVRPFNPMNIAQACNLFFQGKLSLSPLIHEERHEELSHCYIPKIHNPDNYIKFWGTRGSSAVSGSDYVRFGGNSSCLEIRSGDDLIIIDAGTGIRQLGELLVNAQARNIHLFLSHTHWDHITGFPFFNPLYDPEVRLSVWAPVGFELETRDLFRNILAFTFFPVRFEDLSARVEFHELRDGDLVTIGDLFIAAHYAFHPGATLCFRITHGKQSYGYVTDNEFLRGYHGHPGAIDKDHALLKPYHSQIEFLSDVDLLIHEAQYTPLEYQERVGWGHSSISNAAVLLKYTKAKDWIVTHHDPTHTDGQLMRKVQLHRDIVEDCKMSCRVTMAFDGLVLPL
jgi:phosphoribosyl 1,2-cyclic phosphodiesterase